MDTEQVAPDSASMVVITPVEMQPYERHCVGVQISVARLRA